MALPTTYIKCIYVNILCFFGKLSEKSMWQLLTNAVKGEL